MSVHTRQWFFLVEYIKQHHESTNKEHTPRYANMQIKHYKPQTESSVSSCVNVQGISDQEMQGPHNQHTHHPHSLIQHHIPVHLNKCFHSAHFP